MQTKHYELDQYYRFSPFARNWLATAGVMNLAEQKQCYWLLDIIASYAQQLNKMSTDYMLVIEVRLTGNDGAIFTIEHEVNGKKERLITQEIEHTTLTQPITIWSLAQGDSNAKAVLLLPSEY